MYRMKSKHETFESTYKRKIIIKCIYIRMRYPLKRKFNFMIIVFNQNGTNINASLIAFLIRNDHIPDSLENNTITIQAVNSSPRATDCCIGME